MFSHVAVDVYLCVSCSAQKFFGFLHLCGTFTLSTRSVPRLGTGSTQKHHAALSYYGLTTSLGLCKGVEDRGSHLHKPKLHHTIVLGKMALSLFSPLCVPHKGTNHTLFPHQKSLNKLRLLKTKASKVFKQRLLSTMQLKLYRKEIARHKLISQQIILPHWPRTFPWVSVCVAPSTRNVLPLPFKLTKICQPSIVQEALLDLVTEFLRHSFSLPLVLFFISCLRTL